MKKGTWMKYLSILLLATLVVWSTPRARVQADSQTIRIGILQLSDHEALEDSRLGFIGRLDELGLTEGINVEFNYLNAQSDQANLPLMAETLVTWQSDLILSIATPAAQATANATSEIPILATPITSFTAANLVESDKQPNTNVTGTSAMSPIAEQLELLDNLVMNIRTIGFLYNSSEVNSQVQIEVAEFEAAKLGWETVRMSVANTNDVNQAVQSLLTRVDAIYIPTDNTVFAAMPVVSGMTRAANMPVIVGAVTGVTDGALATVGIDFYQLGRQTAEMAYEILINGKKPQTMPIERQKEMRVVINEETAEAIGIVIPENLRGE